MRIKPTAITDCYEIELEPYLDARGSFVKTFHLETFHKLGLETHFPEEFFSLSVQNVLRGLHFAAPPNDQVKVVTCLHGSVLDAFVDLRRGSPTYGKHVLLELSAQRGNMIYLSKGIAHGFYVPSGEAILLYRVSTMYSPAQDKGIHWNSAGIPWPAASPIVSARDAILPAFSQLESQSEFEAVC